MVGMKPWKGERLKGRLAINQKTSPNSRGGLIGTLQALLIFPNYRAGVGT